MQICPLPRSLYIRPVSNSNGYHCRASGNELDTVICWKHKKQVEDDVYHGAFALDISSYCPVVRSYYYGIRYIPRASDLYSQRRVRTCPRRRSTARKGYLRMAGQRAYMWTLWRHAMGCAQMPRWTDCAEMARRRAAIDRTVRAAVGRETAEVGGDEGGLVQIC